jgi:hypothetical protein
MNKLGVRVEIEGHVLEFTEKDIESFEVSTPYDVEDVTPSGKKARLRKLTTPHVKLDVVFPIGAPARWEKA